MRSIGGRTGVGMPVSPAVAHAYGRSSIRTQVASYLETFPNDGDFTVTSEDLPWLVDAGTVASSRCQKTSFYALARAENDTGGVDMFVEADWATGTTTNDDLYLLGRVTTTPATFTWDAIGLFIFRNGSDTEVYTFDWADSATIDTQILTSTSPVATWRLELDGNEARGYRDGVLIITSDISGVSPTPAGTRAAFYLENGTAIDNFAYGDL